MKTTMNKFLALLGITFSLNINAQESKPIVNTDKLPVLNFKENVNLHIISPEPIQFVDLSTDMLEGDLPMENIARIKIKNDDFEEEENKSKIINKDLGIITVVGQSFLAQYRVVNYDEPHYDAETNIQIQPEHMQPLEFPKFKLSKMELRDFCLNIIRSNISKNIRKQKDMGLTMILNNIYVVEDYIFVDMTIKNKTNLTFNVEDIKFSIDDKKIYKATNNQSLEIKPVYQFYHQKKFDKNYRNVYVFEKFTFPNSKVLNIKLIEEQISGRHLNLKIKYSDVLEADTI